jgi:hypothetical protein
MQQIVSTSSMSHSFSATCVGTKYGHRFREYFLHHLATAGECWLFVHSMHIVLDHLALSLAFVAVRHGIQKILNLYKIRSINTAINATWTDGHTASVVAAPISRPIQNDRHKEQSNGLMLAHSSIFNHCLM